MMIMRRILLVCLVLVLFVNASAVEGTRMKSSLSKEEDLEMKSSLSKEEDLELERQLNILNKPPIRTIHAKISGDIIDCIDIYKQPAFDNPLLKNHKIQLTPKFAVETTTVSELPPNVKRARTELEIQGERCPTGSVPIRRTKKEDLIRAKSIYKLNKLQKERNLYKPNAINHTEIPRISIMFVSNVFNDPGIQHHGGEAYLNVHNPEVQENSFTRTEIKLVRYSDNDDNHSIIEVGWTVHPQLYGDHQTRLFTFWTSDDSKEKGCFDVLCTGFVQIDSSVLLGPVLGPISVFNGTQYGIMVNVQREAQSGNWWLMVSNNKVGYWPGNLFNQFDFASYVGYGGIAGAPKNAPLPPMGNGHFPDSNYKTSAYIKQMKVFNADGSAAGFVPGKYGVLEAPGSRCYTLKFFGSDPSTGSTLTYGGPGGYNCY